MLQKGLIDGKIVEVITFDQYVQQPKMYPLGYTAINAGNGVIYPLRGKSDTRPGMYPSNGLCKYVSPQPEEMSAYSADNVTDLSKPKSIGELISKQNHIKAQERTILTNADNIFQPQVKPNDSPAMVAMKTAVNMKHIDLDSYAHRFGSNFANEKRLFEKENLTLGKIIALCNNLDIKASLTLQDADGDIPNPMNDTISVDLTLTGGDDDG